MSYNRNILYLNAEYAANCHQLTIYKKEVLNSMRQNKKIILGIGSFFLVIVVCLILSFAKRAETDKNEEAIRIVTTQIFTCPDEEMLSLFKNMISAMENRISASPEPGYGALESSSIDEKIKELYGPYISDEWYESFLQHFYSNFFSYSIADEYETKVNNIKITQSKEIPSNYEFLLSLNHGLKNGSKENIEMKGSAQFTGEEGKITYLRFFDKDLHMKLRESLTF